MSENSDIEVDFLFNMRLFGGAKAEHTFRSPWGQRRATRFKGGSFSGPRLSGTVVEGLANDWGALSDDGIAGIDCNLVLHVNCGEAIFMTFRGRADEAGNAVIAPLFEASDGEYAWLTEIMAIGHGKAVGDDMIFDVYAIR